MSIQKKGIENKKFISRLGETYINNSLQSLTIVEYFSRRNCTVEFEDGTIVKNINFSNIKTGGIINPNFPYLYGIGYKGIGTHKKLINKLYTKQGVVWNSIFTRCYNEKFQKKHNSYIGCSVCEEWHNFQVFAKWHEENYNPEIMEGWHLDKDILFKGNKIYSPKTCVFVPQEINNLFTNRKKGRGKYLIGVSKLGNRFTSNANGTFLGYFSTEEEAFLKYKEIKEKDIKISADKWKDKITEECYQAMYSYQVEITD